MHSWHLPTIFWVCASVVCSFPHNGFVGLQAFFFFFLFPEEKTTQISYKGISDSGVKKGWIILENTSALGNLHNLDLQAPKHFQNQVRCCFPAFLLLLEPLRSRDQASASASTWMEASRAQSIRSPDHRQLQAKIPKERKYFWNSVLSATSKGNKGLKQWLKGQRYLHKKDHEHKPTLYQY